jgi:hypothetical protein
MLRNSHPYIGTNLVMVRVFNGLFKHGGFNPEVHNSTEIGKVASYL